MEAKSCAGMVLDIHSIRVKSGISTGLVWCFSGVLEKCLFYNGGNWRAEFVFDDGTVI